MKQAQIRSHVSALALCLLPAFCCRAQAQQPVVLRLPFSVVEQQGYLDGLIRNAPSDWAHGKDWVLIQPYLIGRNVTEPVARTVCPGAGIASLPPGSAELPPWIYRAPGICDQLASTHDSALVVLEDPKDLEAAYFLFLACDAKRRRNPCSMEGYYQENGMKLEVSTKRGNRTFDVLVPDDKTSRFLVAEIWHMRSTAPEAGNTQ
jgi:hypothetical protein